MPIVIREAWPEEHARLGELVVAAYRSLPEFDEPDYEPELRDVARRAREAVVLVAVDDVGGPLLGCVTYVPSPDSPWAELLEPGEAAIRMLAVDAAARGRVPGPPLLRRAWHGHERRAAPRSSCTRSRTCARPR